MDITLNVEDYKLNVRVGVIITHENKILLHKNVNTDHYAIIGGRVEIGEDSSSAIKREVLEEIGKEIEITGYISTIENFFEMKGSKYHEIMFVYKAEFKEDVDKKITHTLKNVEGKDYLQYEWLDLEKIDEYLILPLVIKEILKENKFPIHKINNELK